MISTNSTTRAERNDQAHGEFDPYQQWLGINANGATINHYQLLGIARFEGDTRVINEAADARMGLIKSFQNGPHSDATQELLNEIAKARVCLLDEQKRRAYNQQLANLAKNESLTTPIDNDATIDEEILPPPLPKSRNAVERKVAKPPSLKQAWQSDRESKPAPITDVPMEVELPDEEFPTENSSRGRVAAMIALVAMVVWFGCLAIGYTSRQNETSLPAVSNISDSDVGSPIDDHKSEKITDSNSKSKKSTASIKSNHHNHKTKVDQRRLEHTPKSSKQPSHNSRPAAKSMGSNPSLKTSPPDSVDQPAAFSKNFQSPAQPKPKPNSPKKQDPQPAKLAPASDLQSRVAEWIELSKKPTTPVVIWIRDAKVLFDESLVDERFAAARKIASIVESSAKRTKNRLLTRRANALRDQLHSREKERKKNESALAVLKMNAQDGPANTVVGYYLCFFKENWSDGLKHLSQGSHSALRALAQQELQATGNSDEQLALGDAWWQASGKVGFRDREKYQRRAAHWYEQAQAPSERKNEIAMRLLYQQIHEADGWHVVFRSSHASHWNSNVDDRDHFATSLNQVGNAAQFLRMQRIDTGESVIIPINRHMLQSGGVISPRVKWKVPSSCQYGPPGFGIANALWTVNPSQPWIAIDDEHEVAFTGWGFGKSKSDESASFTIWQGVPIADVDLEISVKYSPLSREERDRFVQ